MVVSQGVNGIDSLGVALPGHTSPHAFKKPDSFASRDDQGVVTIEVGVLGMG
jgi:hypothetical protein